MLLDLLFPKQCLNCNKIGTYICETCAPTLQRHKQICIVCREISPKGLTHSYCQKYSHINNLIIACVYKDTIQKAIRSIKYHFAYDIIEELCNKTLKSTKIEQFIKETSIQLVTDIPTHKFRYNQRGFNLPTLIAQWISKTYQIPYLPLLIKTELTASQTSITRKDRYFNVNNTYKLIKENISDMSSILLIDDIFTTGSTIEEAAQTISQQHNSCKLVAMTIASSK